MYHAQPRFGLQRIPRTDDGKPCVAVLELAGFCVGLERRADLSPGAAPAVNIARIDAFPGRARKVLEPFAFPYPSVYL